MHRILNIICLILIFGISDLIAQDEESSIKIFGYFQNELLQS